MDNTKENNEMSVYQEALPIIEMFLPAWFASQKQSWYSAQITERSKNRKRTIYQEKILRLIREYNRILIEKEKALSRKQLKELDRIDMRDILPEANLNSYDFADLAFSKEDKEYAKKYGWLAGMPCFEKGVIQYRNNRYLYFEIDEIYLEYNEVFVFLKDYAYYPGIGWIPGAESTIDVLNAKNPEDGFDIMPESFSNLRDVWLFSIKREELDWSEADIRIWEEFANQMETTIKSNLVNTNIQKDATAFQKSLLQIYSGAIVKINRTFSENKVSRPKKEASVNKAETIIDPQAPIRRIRTVGKLVVQLEKVPKPPTKERVVHYRTASWNVRGHSRTLKSGKVIYINPKIHHRQCMKNRSQDVAKTTIRLKNKTIKEKKI